MTNIETLATVWVVWSVLSYLKKWHDTKLIKTRFINNTVRKHLMKDDLKIIDRYEKDWHKISYFFLAIVAILISYLAFGEQWVFTATCLLGMGLIYWGFDTFLNLLMGWKWNYLGDEWLDWMPIAARWLLLLATIIASYFIFK